MEALEAIRRARVVRAYADRPIDPETLTAIVDAGRHAGSSKNLQRWDFILVTEPATLRRLSAVGRYAEHVPGAAAAIALVTPDPGGSPYKRSIVWDVGRAAQNIVLAAWALGVGSCAVSVYEPDLAREILGYPDDRVCSWLITLGYPADPTDLTRPPRPGGRKGLAQVLHLERW